MLELIGDDYTPPPPKTPPAKVNPDVCQEKYACDKLNCDYPFFYKGNYFNTISSLFWYNCHSNYRLLLGF